MGAIDKEAKAYLSNPKYFSDIFNFWIYNGRQVIKPENLAELDTTEIALPYNENFKEPIQKFRDILKLYTAKFDKHAIYIILGLEIQTTTHYAMPIRNMLYDAMNYTKQISELAIKRKKENDTHSKSEFLSGLKKNDKLKPFITLTLSLSAEEWNGPTSLHEMLDTEDKEILSYVQNYKLNILTPSQIKDEEFDKFQTEFGAIMEFIKHKKDKNMDWMKNNKRIRQINYETISLIQTITGLKFKNNKKGEVVDMWPAWENGLNEAKNEGIEYATIQNIKNLQETLGLSTKQIMDAMKIPLNEQEKYAKKVD